MTSAPTVTVHIHCAAKSEDATTVKVRFVQYFQNWIPETLVLCSAIQTSVCSCSVCYREFSCEAVFHRVDITVVERSSDLYVSGKQVSHRRLLVSR